MSRHQECLQQPLVALAIVAVAVAAAVAAAAAPDADADAETSATWNLASGASMQVANQVHLT